MGKVMTSFDRAVGVVIVGLMVFIGLTLLVGDRVGVRVERVHPLGEAHSTDVIRITFSERMDRENTGDQLQITPDVPGAVRWSGETLLFEPDEPLQTGETYTVTLSDGVVSASGRRLLDRYQFGFEVRLPMVAYLYPADGFPQNIWMADPSAPENAEQITFSQNGVLDFAVRPDGRAIAFSERRNDRPATDIKLLSLETGAITPLTNCEDSDCSSPVWRPDGNMIAYTRVDMNTLLPGVGVSPYRIWLADLTGGSVTTQPLFEDTQALGYGPAWSADGGRITLFDTSVPGVVVYDFETDETVALRSDNGTSGALSPGGDRLVYPEVVLSEGRAWSRLIMALLDTQAIITLTGETEAIDDTFGVWHPSGEGLAVGRRYRDERFTPTTQLYWVDAETGEGEALVVDEIYNHGFVHWDPTGDRLVMQRFQQFTADGTPNRGGRPEIWTYDRETDELTQIAENGMFPRWVP
jgi:Tol biopolymer transport system component